VIYVEEKKKLEHLHVNPNDSEHHSIIISVFGQSGVGKTTLVRDMYKKMAKRNEFQVQAMESFAPHLTATSILQQIAQQLTSDDVNCPRYMTQKILEQKLKNKKYLLVIDGEVSGTKWKNILTTLPISVKGSRIVHITQGNPEEPPSNYYHIPIKLKKIKEDAMMELFCKRLPKELQDNNMKEYRDVICKITEGLPLAIVLLSGLVQTKEFPSEWMKVFDYLRSKQLKNLNSSFWFALMICHMSSNVASSTLLHCQPTLQLRHVIWCVCGLQKDF
jgi:ABC-type dipeptide/oligopeptide/nickel transport system ATPase subunit